MKKLLLGAVALAAIVGTSTGAFAGPPPHPPHPHPPFGFGFGFGFGPPQPYYFNDCEGTDEILSDLGDDGYYHLRIVDWGRHDLTIDARRDGHSYELIVDHCTGDIIDRERI